MSQELSQGIVIEHINQYLKWNNLPIKMDEGGICNGLAMVHAKYVLEGKEQQFMDILACIANGIPKDSIQTTDKNKISNADIDFFIMEALLAFSPRHFNQKLRQSNAMEMLKINGKTLKSSFDFAMVSNDEQWVQIIAKLQLKEGEILQVSSVNHAISLHKTSQGTYRVYDPNYSSGYKEFANEKQLIRELHYNVFHYSKGNLGMAIHVIRHPEALEQERTFPAVTELYDNHLPDVHAKVCVKGTSYTTLMMMAVDAPGAASEYLLNKGATDVYTAAENAVKHNNPQVLSILLGKITEDSEKQNLFKIALLYGRQEAFDELLNHQELHEFYQEKLTSLIIGIWAAQGGNPLLLSQCFDKLKSQMISNVENDEQYKKDFASLRLEEQQQLKESLIMAVNKSFATGLSKNNVMHHAVLSGSAQCIHLVSQQLALGEKPLNNEDRVRYLSEAIRHNHRFVAIELMDMEPKLAPDALQSIQMNALATSRTNLLLLRDLQDRGMVFSEQASSIIAKKEHQAIGVIQSIGIVLSKFTDFIKEYLSGKKDMGVSVHSTASHNIKNKLIEIKNTPDALIQNQEQIPSPTN